MVAKASVMDGLCGGGRGICYPPWSQRCPPRVINEHLPPPKSFFSRTVTRCPILASLAARHVPPAPAPMTMTCLAFDDPDGGGNDAFDVEADACIASGEWEGKMRRQGRSLIDWCVSGLAKGPKPLPSPPAETLRQPPANSRP